MLWLSLASKLGFHPLTKANLSPGSSTLLVSQIATGGTTNVGREYMHIIHICPSMFYRYIMDKRNHLLLVLLLLGNPFLLLSRPNLGSFTS
jgi:hypothetical protein